MSIETLLNEEITVRMDELKDMKVDSKEYTSAIDGLTKLIDKTIEIERLDIERQDKEETRENENDFRLKQMEEDRRNRTIGHCITAAGIIIPSGITIWGTLKSLKFEEEGTITTAIGRGFINKLLPKK